MTFITSTIIVLRALKKLDDNATIRECGMSGPRRWLLMPLTVAGEIHSSHGVAHPSSRVHPRVTSTTVDGLPLSKARQSAQLQLFAGAVKDQRSFQRIGDCTSYRCKRLRSLLCHRCEDGRRAREFFLRRHARFDGRTVSHNRRDIDPSHVAELGGGN